MTGPTPEPIIRLQRAVAEFCDAIDARIDRRIADALATAAEPPWVWCEEAAIRCYERPYGAGESVRCRRCPSAAA